MGQTHASLFRGYVQLFAITKIVVIIFVNYIDSFK